MRLIPLISVQSPYLKEILQEERAEWMRDLKWDYSEPQRIIAEMLDHSELTGHVAVLAGQPAGYSYYLLRCAQGMIGNCFVTSRLAGLGIERRLLQANFDSIRRQPGINRIESQLVDLRRSDPVDFFAGQGFRRYLRSFLRRNCGVEVDLPVPDELRLEPWDDLALIPAAELTANAYRDSLDREMSSHYSSSETCGEFLCGIVSRPGCGSILREASFCLWERQTHRLVGYVLTSSISPGNGHIPQIAIAPDQQGKGLGKLLVRHAISVLAAIGHQSVSLSVTKDNQPAMSLYRLLGFQPEFDFHAYVWERNPH